MLEEFKIPKILKDIDSELGKFGGSLYIVGGAIRDFLIDGRESKDIDVEVHGTEPKILELVLDKHAPGKVKDVGKSFGVYAVSSAGIDYDFSFPRTDSKIGDGHRGFSVELHKDIDFKTAASRRDFTVNAIGVKVSDCSLVDPWDGLNDIRSRKLLHVSDAFGEDPLRALRAVQLAARFNFEIDIETVRICAKQDLSELPPERIYEEFCKLLLKADKPSIGLDYMLKMGMNRFFPEVKNWLVGEMLDRAVEFDTADDDVNKQLMFSVFCMLMELEDVERFLLRLTNEKKLIDAVIRNLSVLDMAMSELIDKEKITDGWVRRLAVSIDIRIIYRLLQVRDLVSTYDMSGWADWLADYAIRLNVYGKKPIPWLTGKDLLEMKVNPGPNMGKVIKESFEKQLDGDFVDKDELLEWVKAHINI